jgi:hypothetical protein
MPTYRIVTRAGLLTTLLSEVPGIHRSNSASAQTELCVPASVSCVHGVFVCDTDDVHRSAARSPACVDEKRLVPLPCREWPRDHGARMRFAFSGTDGASGQ